MTANPPTTKDINKLVRYYHNGWRIGRIKAVVVQVEVIGKKRIRPKILEIPSNEVELVEE